MSERLWAVEDVAEYLGVPRATIYAWNSRQAGPPRIRVGKYIRYRKADIDKWLDEHEVNDAHVWAPPTRRRA